LTSFGGGGVPSSRKRRYSFFLRRPPEKEEKARVRVPWKPTIREEGKREELCLAYRREEKRGRRENWNALVDLGGKKDLGLRREEKKRKEEHVYACVVEREGEKKPLAISAIRAKENGTACSSSLKRERGPRSRRGEKGIPPAKIEEKEKGGESC